VRECVKCIASKLGFSVTLVSGLDKRLVISYKKEHSLFVIYIYIYKLRNKKEEKQRANSEMGYFTRQR